MVYKTLMLQAALVALLILLRSVIIHIKRDSEDSEDIHFIWQIFNQQALSTGH